MKSEFFGVFEIYWIGWKASMKRNVIFPLLILLLLSSCGLQTIFSPRPTSTPTVTPTPTPTPVPLAAKVNGEPITLEEFNHELARFEQAQETLGVDPATLGDYRHTVIQAMIEERVAAQAAVAEGRAVLDDQVDAVVESVRQARGGNAAFQAWLDDNYYTLDEFREAVRRQLLVQAAADAVIATVPTSAEQVHARHILVGNLNQANDILAQVTAGADFAELAQKYSQDFSTNASGGDLGWFPRGILTVPEVEEAAFSLQPGETSEVIQSPLGYHIVQTLERADSSPISPKALEILRRHAVEAWLAQQMQNATIEIYI
jgi:peptidyl-prolyl cis-trans isomerase C